MESCPNCGADLLARAKVCPECGSDDSTGWSEEASSSSLNLPDDRFNYDEFVENEFGEKRKVVPRGVRPFWWVVAIVIIAVFVFLWTRF